MGHLNLMYGKRSPDFIKGVLAGLCQFAWWADGVQYVGTCGMTLREAIREAIDDLAENPEDFDVEKIISNGYV